MLRRVKALLGIDYRDAAHTNSIRLYVMNKLRAMAEAIGATLTVGFGSTTKENRLSLGLPKDHWIDAAVCTSNGNTVKVEPSLKPLIIKAVGRGSRQFCNMDKYGFPRTSPKPRSKNFFGFKTYDIVKVVLPEKSKNAGVHTGRIAVRSSGYFDIVKPKQKINFHHRYAKVVQQADGYVYE